MSLVLKCASLGDVVPLSQRRAGRCLTEHIIVEHLLCAGTGPTVEVVSAVMGLTLQWGRQAINKYKGKGFVT